MESDNMGLVRELVQFARENSPYYRRHYQSVPKDFFDITQLPVLDHKSFWEANAGLPPENRVLTCSSLIDGAIFRTGGTTATPKASFVTREELRKEAQGWTDCLIRAGMLPGDRVANLLYGGDLYKGFSDLSFALTEASIPNFHLPIGVAPLDSQAWTLRTFSATVVVSMPTVVCKLADYLVERKQPSNSVRLILYLGELLQKDQKTLLRRAFPSARIGPIQYASVDGGCIALPDSLPSTSDEGPTIYNANTERMVVEIITDDNSPITEEGVRGNIIITNLVRRLMPIIRYPMGDVAEWTDYRKRKFRLCGRGMIGIRIGGYAFDLTTLKNVVSKVMAGKHFSGFQAIITREAAADKVIFRIASQPKDPEQLEKALSEELARMETGWVEVVEEGIAEPLAVEWVSIQDMLVNRRTGKLREIVDLRVE